MIGQNPATQIRTIVAATEAVGAKLPTAALEAQQQAARAMQGLQGIYPKGGLAGPIAAALIAGRDPATDPDIVRTYIAMQVGNSELGGRVENILTEEMRQVFAAHADAIVKAWTRPFEKAAAVLIDAHSRLGDVSLDDTAAIVQRGGDAAEVWGRAQTASRTIVTITDAWVALAEFAQLARIDQRYAALRIASVDHETWQAQQLERKRLTPWDAVVAGLSLSLPTMEQYRERVTALEQGMALAAQLAAANAPVDRGRQHVREWASKVDAARTSA